MPVNKKISFSVLCAFLTIGAVMFVHNFKTPMQMLEELPYSEFKTLLAAGNVAEVTVTRQSLLGKLKPEEGSKEPKLFTTVRVEDPDLVKELNVRNVKFTGMIESTFLRDIMWWVIPALIFVGIWFFVIRRLGHGLGQGQKGFMTVGKSKAKIYAEKDTKVTFADVAGVDEAKEELREVIDFLKTPEKFTRLGGKIPKGILLVGPPGTGKTLLARAVAGEAGVTFFSISGSEFVEMFVGVGASRVRDLFEQAKIKAPCIIFIDELDALGKARGAGPMAHEEREQTLNQLLVEMDGFDPRIAVILMAATNRPEILDPALLRPGRFDRQVLVDRPDKISRLAILRVHAKQVTLGPDADLEMIAAMTPGFSGADLANIINEATLLTVRRNKEQVGLSELQEAVERVVAGLEKKNRVLNKMERERVAHHEVGHALVALSFPGADLIQKISIIPRGIAALGYTLQLQTEDRFLMAKTELENKIAVLLGGRNAEELIFGEASTGAQNDLVRATDIAKSMVKSYGMSEKLGTVTLDRERQPLIMQIQAPQEKGDYSEETAREIDCEVRRIIDEQYDRVRWLLAEKKRALVEGAKALLDREVITGSELRAIMDNH
ncbi:MAG TPA: ATP-dependent zinc metalloprotease FtsH [Nitrospiraceae bacterium]|nr:ATP-dependent zinc metalloprotease FtsH [Nitrospiraceae bacterium]